MPSFMSRTALAVACLIVTAQAFPSTLAEDPQAPVDEHGLPTVTPVFGGSDCESFGAGNFSLIISHCTNSTTNEPCDIEGFRNNVVPPPEGSGDGLASEGSVAFPVTDEEPAVNKLHCYVASRSVEVVEIYASGHGPGLSSSRVGLANGTDSVTSIVWSDIVYNVLPQGYDHYTQDGDRFEGSFLGRDKETGWAVKYSEATPGSEDGLPHWVVRLLPKGDELREGESATWLKIEGSF